MVNRIILDADTGIDDALALAYLLAKPEVDLLGVVGTYGNVHARLAHANNRLLLRACGRGDVPVAMGCTAPSWASWFAVDEGCARFHGANGFGGVDPVRYGLREGRSDGCACAVQKAPDEERLRSRLPETRPCPVPQTVHSRGVTAVEGDSKRMPVAGKSSRIESVRPVESERSGESEGMAESVGSVGGSRTDLSRMPQDAVRACRGEGVRMIVDAVRRHGREVTVLANGPLTDVDAAIRMAPGIADGLRLVMMGGTLTQQGNCYDLVCETNIIQDPEAADRVFHSGAEITMVGLDVTHQCLLTRRDIARWSATGGALGRFLAQMAAFYIAANESSDPVFAHGSPLHDPLAAVVALDPSVVGTFPIAMMAETSTGDGCGVRGRTIGDRTRLLDHANHGSATHVALSVEAERAHDDIVGTIAGLCRERA